MNDHDNDMEFMEGYPELMTPGDVQDILQIGKTSMYKLLRSGEIKSARIGGMYRIPRNCLIEYISAQL